VVVSLLLLSVVPLPLLSVVPLPLELLPLELPPLELPPLELPPLLRLLLLPLLLLPLDFEPNCEGLPQSIIATNIKVKRIKAIKMTNLDILKVKKELKSLG